MNRHLHAVAPEIREQIRQIVLTALQRGDTPTLQHVYKTAKLRKSTASVVMRAYRAGVLDPNQPWRDATVPAERELSDLDSLLQHVLQIDSHEACNHVLRRLTAGALNGSFSATEARAARECLGELRQNLRAAREAGEDADDHEPVALVGPDVFQIVTVIQGIVCDELREEVCAFVVAKANEDRERFPNPTIPEAQALRARPSDEGASS